MNRRAVFLARLIALGLLPAMLAACATELTDDAITPTAPAAPGAAPTRTPAPPPTSPSSPIATPEPAPVPTEPVPVERASVEHTVQKGDTLLGLARQYGVPMAAIQLQNGMGDSTVVQVGRVLSIPPQAGWEEASAFWVVHVVEEGETLVGIARAYGLKAAMLKAVNELADADLIRVGQELVLPLDGPAVARAPAPTVAPPSPTPVPATAPAQAAPAPTAAPAAPPPADVAAWPRETVRLINEVRTRHGLPPLAYDETLARAAQGQANDCAQRSWCSHTGSDGSNIKTRILRAGYEPASWAECWAQRQTPQGAVDIWMDEVPPNDPHRRTLLTTWLSEIGVGVAQTSWGYYFIADFGRP
ncbi:MAG TPA: LysM peptidoglycan-binding domain-containing protein [Anaerolineae bacterium]|nr:LysM peptidoglycan-binding domain-containing protein [Anaerolineae bacterium]